MSNKGSGDDAYEQMLRGVTKSPPKNSGTAAWSGAPEDDPDDINKWASEESCVLTRPRPLFGLGIKRPGKLDKIIEYHDVEGDGDNGRLEIVMGARKVWLLRITGSRLLRLLYQIKEHRVEAIRQANRDIDPEDGRPFISLIEVTDVTPRP